MLSPNKASAPVARTVSSSIAVAFADDWLVAIARFSVICVCNPSALWLIAVTCPST